jgi:putative ABC transport system permease protein
MGHLVQDVRYGIRVLLKGRGFTVVALLTLMLGIGANSAIFSVVNAVLLRHLPYPDPDRLVILWEQAPRMQTSVAYLNFEDWQKQNRVFDQITAFRRDSFNLTGAGEPERLNGRMVSAGFFATFGKSLFRGRDFSVGDDRPGAEPAVIISHGFWQRRFGGDESIVGRQLKLNDRDFTVIGVAAADFQFGAGADVFAPIGLWSDRYQDRGSHPGLYVVGRMKQGCNIEQARGDLDGIMAGLGELHPKTNSERRIHIEPLYENTVQDVRRSLLIVLGAVGFVLLIGCANVANLLLARAAVREKEIALRCALGARRSHIIGQLLTESMLLSVTGGALGLLVAVWGKEALISFVPEGIPRLQEATLDFKVLAFTLVASLITGVVFGLAPALQAAKLDLNEALKEGGRSSTGGRHRLRNLLVVGEVALALVLLVGAGLMLRSFMGLQKIKPGFEARDLLTMQLSMTVTPEKAEKARSFFDQLQQSLVNVPGVKSVAVSNGLPLAGATETAFWIEGDTFDDPQTEKMAVIYVTSPGYLEAMGIRLLRGRYFTAEDRRETQAVAAIDETLAAKFFPNEDPIGKRLVAAPGEPNPAIVGVVAHVKHYGFVGQVPVESQLYFPIKQVPAAAMPFIANRINVLVRAYGDPTSLSAVVSGKVYALDKNQPVYNVRTMESIVAGSLAGNGSRRCCWRCLRVWLWRWPQWESTV